MQVPEEIAPHGDLADCAAESHGDQQIQGHAAVIANVNDRDAAAAGLDAVCGGVVPAKLGPPGAWERKGRAQFRSKRPSLARSLLASFDLARGGRRGLGGPVDRCAWCGAHRGRGYSDLGCRGRTKAGGGGGTRRTTRRRRGCPVPAWLKEHDEERTRLRFTSHVPRARLGEQHQQRARVRGHDGSEDRNARPRCARAHPLFEPPQPRKVSSGVNAGSGNRRGDPGSERGSRR